MIFNAFQPMAAFRCQRAHPHPALPCWRGRV